MSGKVKSFALLAAGFAVMLVANFYIGETPLGWATMIAGIGLYYMGWRGVCPACQAGRCKVAPPKASSDQPSFARRQAKPSAEKAARSS
jgi:hypothetical protein